MQRNFSELMTDRRSIRRYLDRPVPRDTVEAILRLARSAPSGANLQPGHFHVLTGAPLASLIAGLQAAIDAGDPQAR